MNSKEITDVNYNLISENDFGSVKQKTTPDKGSEIIISHPSCNARLSLFGGHVLSWKPIGQSEVFWLSNNAIFDNKSPIRGGIPLCWPWFGPFGEAGNHGFARTSLWTLGDVTVSQQSVTVELTLSGANFSTFWPSSFVVKQRLIFSEKFYQQLIIENTSDEEIQFSNALHSYFSVSSPENVAIPDLNNSVYDDKIKQTSNCKPSDVFDCIGPIDKIYHNKSTATLFDKGLKRAIEITKSNSSQWVLWNPGVKLAKNFKDIHHQGEQGFVCLEASNTDWVKVHAGEKYSLSQEIIVYKI